MAVLATVKVGRDFRITLPKEARELLGLKEGDDIIFFETGSWIRRVCFRKAHGRALQKWESRAHNTTK